VLGLRLRLGTAPGVSTSRQVPALREELSESGLEKEVGRMEAKERARIDGLADGLAIAAVVAQNGKTAKEIREGIARAVGLAQEATARADYATLREMCDRS
jgi:hypothetical protein